MRSRRAVAGPPAGDEAPPTPTPPRVSFDDPEDEPILAWRGGAPSTRWPEELIGRQQATTAARRWSATLVAAVASGPFAIAAALVENSAAGVGFLVAAVVVGPLVEELVKGAGALYLAEERPWLVPAAWVLPAVAVTSGLVFASIENWLYLEVLIDDPSDHLIRWRWVFGPLVHGTGSLLVGLGATRLWRTTLVSGRRRGLGPAERFIVAAALVHGSYNLAAAILEAVGVIG